MPSEGFQNIQVPLQSDYSSSNVAHMVAQKLLPDVLPDVLPEASGIHLVSTLVHLFLLFLVMVVVAFRGKLPDVLPGSSGIVSNSTPVISKRTQLS